MTKDSNHPLAHVLKLNSDPGYGMKATRVPAPGKPDVQVFAKGGKVGKLVQFYAKGGPVRACAKGGKIKASAKKSVIKGTAKEAADIIGALKSAKKPASPPPGIGMPPMMKKGGKVARKKMAAGGAARVRLKEPKPNKIDKVNYPRGG